MKPDSTTITVTFRTIKSCSISSTWEHKQLKPPLRRSVSQNSSTPWWSTQRQMTIAYHAGKRSTSCRLALNFNLSHMLRRWTCSGLRTTVYTACVLVISWKDANHKTTTSAFNSHTTSCSTKRRVQLSWVHMLPQQPQVSRPQCTYPLTLTFCWWHVKSWLKLHKEHERYWTLGPLHHSS